MGCGQRENDGGDGGRGLGDIVGGLCVHAWAARWRHGQPRRISIPRGRYLRGHTPARQGDFENGFGDDPDICAETVRLAAEVGLAGICIEDISFPAGTPYDFDLAVERMKAAASAARALPHGFVLTARADGIMTGAYDTDEAIRRLQAFEAAGVDCLYAPLPPTLADVARICTAVTKPVNVLVAGKFAEHTMDDFAKAGAARLSLGSSLARVTHNAIFTAGQNMLQSGDFSGLKAAMSGDAVEKMLS